MRTISLALLMLSGLALAADSQKRPTDEQRGKELYERHCVSCHGAQARGDGPATQALVVPIPDLAGKVKVDGDNLKETIKIVQLGRGAMPSFEASFDNDDARRVVQWMAKVHKASTAAPAPAEPADDTPAGDAQGDGPGEGPPEGGQ